MARDLLSIDVMKDLKRVDSFINKLINDKTTQERFFKNPSRVMIELGFHAPTTSRAVGISNRVFYLTLTNKKLIQYCMDNMPQFTIPEDLQQKTLAALARGQIRVDPKVDQIILEAYLKDEKHLQTMFMMSLTDLNKKGVFSRRFTSKEISAYVEKLLLHIRKRRSMRELPMLDRFGPNYGVGFVSNEMEEADSGGVCWPSDAESDAGGICYPSDLIADTGNDTDSGSNASSPVEVGAWTSAALLTEVVAVATVLGPIIALGIMPKMVDQITNIYCSDGSSRKAVATMAKLISFSSDLALYAQNIERLGYFGKP